MNTYVNEVLNNHMVELDAVRKEKTEQLQVNQLIVKKVQVFEKHRKEQVSLNQQFSSFVSSITTHVSYKL